MAGEAYYTRNLAGIGGGWITSDYQRLIVPADGAGYELTLNEGWKIVAGAREGDKTITR